MLNITALNTAWSLYIVVIYANETDLSCTSVDIRENVLNKMECISANDLQFSLYPFLSVRGAHILSISSIPLYQGLSSIDI